MGVSEKLLSDELATARVVIVGATSDGAVFVVVVEAASVSDVRFKTMK